MFKYNIETAKEITKAALIGEATGDALGVPVEFMPRSKVRRINLKEMVGCDTGMDFDSVWGKTIPAGAWSDDTSMVVAAMDSIIKCNGSICPGDIMKRFLAWVNDGKYSSVGYCFDIGGTTRQALLRYREGTPAAECGPSNITDNGNGALMRILPFSLWCIYNDLDFEATVNRIDYASGITHGHEISKLGCVTFTLFLKALLYSESVQDAWNAVRAYDFGAHYGHKAIAAYSLLFSDSFIDNAEGFIGQTGYVVDTLMTAVYSMLTGTDYESTVLTAIGMGFDTDTNAAVTGALAGAFYGLDDIPERWTTKLLKRDYLEQIAVKFANAVFGA